MFSSRSLLFLFVSPFTYSASEVSKRDLHASFTYYSLIVTKHLLSYFLWDFLASRLEFDVRSTVEFATVDLLQLSNVSYNLYAQTRWRVGGD